MGFSAIHVCAFILAAIAEMGDSSAQYKISQSQIVLPTMAFCLWGLSDAMINAFQYWIIGQLYSNGGQRAQAIGFLKLLNSAAHVVGYAILPEDRVSATVQLWYNIIAYLVGAAGAYVVA